MAKKKPTPLFSEQELKQQIAELEQEVQEAITQRRNAYTPAPNVDPYSPDFDLSAFVECIRSTAATIDKALQSFYTISARVGIFVDKDPKLDGSHQAVDEIMSATRQALADNMPIMAQRLQHIEDEHSAEALEKIEALETYLCVELEEAGTAFAAYTVWDIIEQGFTPEGEPADGIFKEIIERAIRRKREYESIEFALEHSAQTQIRFDKMMAKAREEVRKKKITARPTDRVDFPLDKPNREIWDLLSGTKYNNQLQLATVTIDTSKGKKKRETGIIYGISFDKLEEAAPNLKITKQLTQYDKRVYIAASAIFNAGNEVTTATQIYRVMGNTGKPKAADVKKINDSLTKMGAARVYLNNSHEAKTYTGYPVFKYDADLLPFERVTATVNGQVTETAIHFFREPPLMTFAKERKQITTLPLQLLESPVSKTDANLAIDDYLLERISHIKKGKANPKILYESLYEKCRITTKKQKQRTPEKIKRYLDHYKECDFIYDYAEESDGIYIYVSRAAKADKRKNP